MESENTGKEGMKGIVQFLHYCKIVVEWKFDFIWLSLLIRDRVCLLFFTKNIGK